MRTQNPLLNRILHYLQLTENSLLLLLAVVVGISTGLSVFLFRKAIETFEHFFHESLPAILPLPQPFSILIFLALAGLFIGSLRHYLIGPERHHGVAGIIESVALVGGRLRYKIAPIKAFAASLSIGVGASVGPEDPSVQIGANWGSFLGQRLRLSEERIRLLVAAGSASAISAAFNAPIAGVFFALEVILADFTTASVGVVVLAAVMSSVTTLSIASNEPELGIFSYQLGGAEQIPFYIILGFIAAPVAVLFIRMVYWQHDLWHRWPLPQPIKTALAGVLVGVAAWPFPQILGTGHHAMEDVLNTGGADFSMYFLFALVFAKLLMTSVSMAGGFLGGIFAPSLFVGAMLGGAYGRLIERLPGEDLGNPAAYAIAGMGAMMAGVVRAPITAILLIFEITNDYQLIVPIMLTTVVCVFFAERYEASGIYALGLKRQGFHLQQGRDIDVMQSITVEEVMSVPPPSISEGSSLGALREAFRQFHSHAICVLDKKGRLMGVVTLTDLQSAYERVQLLPPSQQEQQQVTVGDICSRHLVTISPDEPVWTAIRRMGEYHYQTLPVVAADDPLQLVGLLRRSDVMRGYSIAINRKWESQYVQNQIRLSNLVRESVFELRVLSGAAAVDKKISELPLPYQSVIASIRRGNKLVLPHGRTVIYPQDILTVISDPDSEAQLRGLFEQRASKADTDE